MDDHFLKASWASLFLVTAFSAFLFSGILKVLDGRFNNLLLGIGAAASFCALISWLVMIQKQAKKKTEQAMSSENNPG